MFRGKLAKLILISVSQLLGIIGWLIVWLTVRGLPSTAYYLYMPPIILSATAGFIASILSTSGLDFFRAVKLSIPTGVVFILLYAIIPFILIFDKGNAAEDLGFFVINLCSLDFPLFLAVLLANSFMAWLGSIIRIKFSRNY